MDRRTWQATVHGAAKSWTQLSTKYSTEQLKYRYRNYNYCYLERGEEKMREIVFNRFGISVWEDEHFLEVDGVDDCATM